MALEQLEQPMASPTTILTTTTFSAVIVTKAKTISQCSSKSNMPIQNPVILVTGASRGLGYAITNLLLSPPHSADVIAVSRSPFPDHSCPAHAQLTTIQADVSSPETATATIAQTIEAYGRLDGIIINHGTLDPVERIGETRPETNAVPSGARIDEEIRNWRKGFDVNFFSAVALVKAALPALRKSKGRVIFVSSGAAINANAGWGAYSASKAALNSLCRTLTVEEPDVTTIAIRPGVVDTPMQKEIREKHREIMGEGHQKFVNFHSEGKLLRPEEPGAVIAKLAISAKKELSGNFLRWDAEELKEYQ